MITAKRREEENKRRKGCGLAPMSKDPHKPSVCYYCEKAESAYLVKLVNRRGQDPVYLGFCKDHIPVGQKANAAAYFKKTEDNKREREPSEDK